MLDVDDRERRPVDGEAACVQMPRSPAVPHWSSVIASAFRQACPAF